MNFEKESINRMIIAAINKQNVEAIEKIAQGDEDVAIAAQYILDPETHFEEEHNEILLKVQEIATQLSEYVKFTPQHNFPDFQNKEAWNHFAKIGKWEYWDSIYDIVALNHPPAPTYATEQRSLVAWAWCWTTYQNKDARKAAEQGHLFRQLSHCPPTGAGYAIACGLLLAVEWGWVIPQDKQQFLLDYCRWTSYGQGQVIGYPLSHMDLSLGHLSNEFLQELAIFYDTAAYQLGFRHVKLLMPSLQCKLQWKKGVESSVPQLGFDGDVEAFLKGSPIERHELFDRHCHFTSKSPMGENPEDPFGDKVPLFGLKVGTFEYPPLPTYEEAIAYIDSLS